MPEEAPVMEEPTVEETPAPEAAPVEEAPAVEEAPLEEAPVEEVPAEEAPVEEEPAVEEAPVVEETPAEEAPAAEEAPVETMQEEAPAVEVAPAAEEAPVEGEAPAAEDVPVPQEAPVDAAPEAEAPVDAAPEAPAAEEPAVDGAPVEDPAAAPAQPLPGEAPAGTEVPVEGAPDATGGEQGTVEQPAPEMLQVEDGAPILDSAKEEPLPAEATVDPNADPNAAGADAAVQAQPVPAQDPEEVERLRQRIEALEAQRSQRPTSDAEAQAIAREFAPQIEVQSVIAEQGQRIDVVPTYERPNNITIINQTENRYVYEVNNRYIVENNDRERIAINSQDVYYEELPRGRVREVVLRENGSQIITIRNRYGDIVQRSRVRPNGQEVVLFYAPEYDQEEQYVYVDPGTYLPPLQLTIPVDEYIYDSTRADDYTDYVTFFEQPPIEPVTEIYSVEEVKRSARVRDIMPRVDLDNITFDFGSASISESQVPALEEIANAMIDMLETNESEIFLLEGHTDAVGSDQANLLLSDQRAESIAVALTNVFGIPPENLQTQGYGERFLKVNTQEPEQLNRRVTVRRITPLVQSAQAQ